MMNLKNDLKYKFLFLDDWEDLDLKAKDLTYLFENNFIEYANMEEINNWFKKSKNYLDQLKSKQKVFEELVVQTSSLIKNIRYINNDKIMKGF